MHKLNCTQLPTSMTMTKIAYQLPILVVVAFDDNCALLDFFCALLDDNCALIDWEIFNVKKFIKPSCYEIKMHEHLVNYFYT